MALVSIVMGSDSDLPVMKKAADVLRERIDFSLQGRFKGAIALGVIVFTTGNRELLQNRLAALWTKEGI